MIDMESLANVHKKVDCVMETHRPIFPSIVKRPKQKGGTPSCVQRADVFVEPQLEASPNWIRRPRPPHLCFTLWGKERLAGTWDLHGFVRPSPMPDQNQNIESLSVLTFPSCVPLFTNSLISRLTAMRRSLGPLT